MGVNPTSWSPTIEHGHSDSQIVTVSASSGPVKGVTVSKISGPTWLSVSPTNLGDIASGSSKTFTMTASPPAGTSGDFAYTVRVSNTCGSPSTRDVSGNITVPFCTAEYAVYQAGVPDPEGILDPLRVLRDGNLKAEYVDRYYDYSPELTRVITRDPALVLEAARLLVKYSPMVEQEVYGIGKVKLITRSDVEEIVSFTDRLKSGVRKNSGEIGATRSQEITKYMDEFKGQVEASEGKTFSEALQDSIYCKDKHRPGPGDHQHHGRQ